MPWLPCGCGYSVVSYLLRLVRISEIGGVAESILGERKGVNEKVLTTRLAIRFTSKRHLFIYLPRLAGYFFT